MVGEEEWEQEDVAFDAATIALLLLLMPSRADKGNDSC